MKKKINFYQVKSLIKKHGYEIDSVDCIEDILFINMVMNENKGAIKFDIDKELLTIVKFPNLPIKQLNYPNNYL
ncbi:hypothetical protein JS510_00315 [Mycoplasma tauri]|uniref:hypothetical protein n=1 Tax=Mycoplasma tauri TaxID=547987 RepID=UPI0019676881|nr:hypothetical protein [Mycoplasma tauri]QSB07566.1 hypothetical protein JS510_00315 [Mycoplasma tauri]